MEFANGERRDKGLCVAPFAPEPAAGLYMTTRPERVVRELPAEARIKRLG
jgi:hypothetical protein